jgi:hypothetical protein
LERNHLENLGVDGMTLKMNVVEKVRKGVDWINLTHNRDKSRAVVNTVMNLQVRERRSYGLLHSKYL